MFPCRGEVILPPLHAPFRRASVFDKKELTTGFEHAPHLRKRMARLRYAAQRPCRDNRVDASVFYWNVLRGPLHEVERYRGSCCCVTSDVQELRRGVKSENLSNGFAIEWPMPSNVRSEEIIAKRLKFRDLQVLSAV